MILKIYKPITSTKRHCIDILNFYSHKTPVIKVKLKKQNKISGRNNSGKITIFNRGNSHKRRFRFLENSYSIVDSEAIVYSTEYDPNRNSLLISIFDIKFKKFFYLIAPNGIKLGDFICSGSKAKENLGHSLAFNIIPIGCPVFNVSNKYSRSAGTFAVLIQKSKTKVQLILSSGKTKYFSIQLFATLGSVSNIHFFLKQLGKAGKSRWLGKKPKVKGIAMNPVDHPNGGGENKKSSKRKSPWGRVLRSKA